MKNQNKWKPSRVFKTEIGYTFNENAFALASWYIGNLIIPKYSEVIKQNISGIMLDCGCGQVPYYLIYKEKASEVVCIDWDVSSDDYDFLDFKADLNKPLDFFKDQYFDSILLADVLEHIYNPNQLVSELSRILKPKGKIVVFVPFLYWVHSQPNDYFRYTEFFLRKIFEENQQNILKLDSYGGYLDVVFVLIN